MDWYVQKKNARRTALDRYKETHKEMRDGRSVVHSEREREKKPQVYKKEREKKQS